MTRAALVTLGTSTVALTPGCAPLPKDHTEDTTELDATADAMVVVFYGSAIGMGGGSTGVSSGGSTTGQCATAQDCESPASLGTSACCVLEQCLFGTAAMNVACADPQVQLIQASNYDQSCDADTDCLAVAEGNFCIPGAANCPNAAINKSAKAPYLSDVANTNAAFCVAPSTCPTVSCGGSTGPWCVHGTCSSWCVSSGCDAQACAIDDAGPDGPYPGGETDDDGG